MGRTGKSAKWIKHVEGRTRVRSTRQMKHASQLEVEERAYEVAENNEEVRKLGTGEQRRAGAYEQRKLNSHEEGEKR